MTEPDVEPEAEVQSEAGPSPDAAPWIVVGYDGSDPAKVALTWAAEYAAKAERRLQIVHAWMWPLFTHNLGPVQGIEGSGLRHAAEEILTEGVALAHETSPELKVETDLKAGLPAEVLLEESEGADLLVVGNRGIGGLLGQLVGSVSLDLSGSSKRPLLVVRYSRRQHRPVMACIEGGTDGQASSPSVLSEATKMAGFLGEALHIVHAVPPEKRHQHESPEEGRAILDRAAEAAARLAPDLTVTTALLQGRGVAKDLLAEASGAEVMVLGGHRPGGSPGAVATAVLKHAPCNIMIAR